MRVALVTLLLVIDLGPEGMPHRLCRPLHKRLPEELWTLETPVHPGFLAAAFGHRRDPRIFLQCSGGGIAFPEDVSQVLIPAQKGLSKFVAIDEESNHEIVHVLRLGEAQRAADEALDPGPQIAVCARSSVLSQILCRRS